MINASNHIHQQGGFSLIEALLAIGIISLIVMGAAQVTQDWAERVRHRDEANYLVTVSEAAKSYVSANFAAIMQGPFAENLNSIPVRIDNDETYDPNRYLINIGRVTRISIESEEGELYLKDGSIGLPGNFRETSPLGRNVSIYVRNLGFIGEQLTLQVLVATSIENINTARPLTTIAANDVARAIGPSAGIFSTREGCSHDVLAVYGNWSFSGNILNSATYLMDGTVPYCPPSNENLDIGDYIVLQDRVSYSSVASRQYLYRTPIAGIPDANRMETNLDMNNYEIQNVSALSVDNLIVDGSAYIASKGGIALYVDQALRVAGIESRISGTSLSPSIFGGSVRATNVTANSLNHEDVGGCMAEGCPVPDPRTRISLNAGSIESSGSMTVEGNMVVGDVISVPSGEFSVARSASANTYIENGGYINAGELQAVNLAQTHHLQTGNLTAGILDFSQHLSAHNLEITDSFYFGGNSRISGHLTAREMQINHLSNCQASVIFNWQTRRYERTGNIYNCVRGPPRTGSLQ